MMVKAEKKRQEVTKAYSKGKKAEKGVRAYNDCAKCGRTRAYIRFFGLCRICLREEARNGNVTGLHKASW